PGCRAAVLRRYTERSASYSPGSRARRRTPRVSLVRALDRVVDPDDGRAALRLTAKRDVLAGEPIDDGMVGRLPGARPRRALLPRRDLLRCVRRGLPGGPEREQHARRERHHGATHRKLAWHDAATGAPRHGAGNGRRHRGRDPGEIERACLALDQPRDRLAQPGQLANRAIAVRTEGRMTGHVEQLGWRQLRINEAVKKLRDVLTGHRSQRRARSLSWSWRRA